MRVVTTCHKEGLELYGHRWLDGRKNWPKGTDFQFYREGFDVDCPGKDFRDLPEFIEWKMKHIGYVAPGWEWDVVRYSHKVFAAADALYDYKGIGVWLDADCITYKPISRKTIEMQVANDVYMACYQRTGLHTETGLWIVNCAHPEHKAFLDFWRNLYFSERYKDLPQWTDCHTLDATIRAFRSRVKIYNLSGEHHTQPHPQAKSELGKYIDHTKGRRKIDGFSAENTYRGHLEPT